MSNVHANTVASLEREIKELKKRIRKLEAAPRIPNTSQRGGTFTLLDPDGEHVALYYGDWDAWGITQYGVAMKAIDSNGEDQIIFGTTSDSGLWIGPNASTIRDLNAGLIIVNSDNVYVPTWGGTFAVITSDSIHCVVGWTTDAATTGEVRLSYPGGGTATDPHTLDAGTNGYAYFSWVHGVNLGTGIVQFNIEAQRTSGTGDVHIYVPSVWQLGARAAIGATDTGAVLPPGQVG